MKKKIGVIMAVMAGVLAITACEQKPIEVKSEKAQEDTAKETTDANKASETTKQKSAKSTELSDDIYAFEVSIDKKILQFPMTYSKFTKYGWEYQGNEEDSIPAVDDMVSDWFKKGDNQTMTYLTNFDIQNIPIPNSYVTGIVLTKDYIKDEDSKVLLPNEIELGVATQTDVTNAYGEPTEIDDSDSFPTMTYELDTDQFVTLAFDVENGDVLSEITLKNKVEPEDFELSESTYEMPEAVTDYVTPEMISNDLFDYTIYFDGALYRLPAPVSEYIANGWTLVESKSDILIESGKTGKATLVKDNQTFWIDAINLGENTDEVLNCFAMSLAANVKDCNVDMEISSGIKMGMSQEELEAAIADYAYKKEVSNYTYYEIVDPDQIECGYEIIVKDGKITGIEVTL